ncbi:MAG: transporter substrate-binding domain-containing protein [Oscillospiraceae bacterium]|jgi:putative lysine transport system substrate-binding protein|nr:transporter substrate-binding domain-containing protein [Oscillospiraceae bacterium]
MKKAMKFATLLLAMLLAVALMASCASTPASPSQAPATESQAPGAAPSEPAATKQILRVGMECAYAPYNWSQVAASDYTVALSDGMYADGYDVQIAKLIADGLGMELEVVKSDWDGLPPSLTSGKIDLIIAGMTDTAERRETIDFTDVYWSSEMHLVVLKNGAFAAATSLNDFAGAKITGQLGTIHYDLIDQIPAVLKQDAMADFPTMLMALASGKVDAYVSEWPAAISAQKANSDVTFIDFADGDGFSEDVTVSIGIAKGSDDLKAQIDGILAGITAEQRQSLMEGALERQPLSE